MLGVALAFSVHLINGSALNEFSQAARTVGGQSDLEVRSAQGRFDENIYALVAKAPAVAVASPVLELSTHAVAGDQKINLRLLGMDALRLVHTTPSFMPRPDTDAGRFALFAPATVFLNASARRQLPGSTLRLQNGSQMLEVQVAGTVDAGGPPLAVMDLGAAQDLFWTRRRTHPYRCAAGARPQPGQRAGAVAGTTGSGPRRCWWPSRPMPPRA